MSTPETTPQKAANPFREAVASTQDLVECLGVTKVYLGKLAADGKLEKAGRDQWNAFETVRLFTEHLRNRKVNQHDGEDGDQNVAMMYERERARKMKADAEIAEITADLMKGRIHEAKAVEELWIGQQMACRSKLLSMPSKLAAESPPELSAKILSIATDIVHEALEQLADYDPHKIAERTDRKRVADPIPTADDAVVETAAEVDSEPVG